MTGEEVRRLDLFTQAVRAHRSLPWLKSDGTRTGYTASHKRSSGSRGRAQPGLEGRSGAELDCYC